MKQRWLIRTTSNQLLGPISKEKLLELLEKGSLTDDDEVCSGNGYWIHLRENSLVKRYLHGEEPQTFNPISEAQTVLSAEGKRQEQMREDDESGAIEIGATGQTLVQDLSDVDLDDEEQDGSQASVPDETDLEYPDVAIPQESSSEKESASPDGKMPDEEDLEYPDPKKPGAKPDVKNNKPKGQLRKSEELNLSVEVQEHAGFKIPSEKDLAYPDIPGVEEESPSKNVDALPAMPSDIVNSDKTESNDIESDEVDEIDEEKEEEVSEELEHRKAMQDEMPEEDEVVLQEMRAPKKSSKKVRHPSRNDRFLLYLFIIILGLMLAGVAYYYSEILQKPVPFIGKNSLFIQDAYAQITDESLTKKKTLIEYEPIVLPEGVIVPRVNYRGFLLDTVRIAPPESCEAISNYSTKFLILVSKINGKMDLWDEYLKKCAYIIPYEFKTMLTLAEKDLKSRSSLQNFLTQHFSNESDRKQLFDIYEQKKKMAKEQAIFPDMVSSLVVLMHQETTRSKLYFDNSQKMKMINRRERSLFSYVAEILIAIRADNLSWARKTMKTLLKQDRNAIVFEMDRFTLRSKEDQNRVYRNLIGALSIISEKLDRSLLSKLLVRYFKDILEEEDYRDLKSQAELNWSLIDIRNFLKIDDFRKEFIMLWYSILQERTLEIEATEYLKGALKETLVVKNGILLFPLYLHYYPIENKALNILVKKDIEILANSSRLYDQDMLYQLLSVDRIKKDVGLKMDVADSKRKFYQNILKDGKAIEYALYNSYKLGDYEDSLLWWLLL